MSIVHCGHRRNGQVSAAQAAMQSKRLMEKLGAIFGLLVFLGQPPRLFAAPPTGPVPTALTPASSGGLADPSKLLLLFDDDDDRDAGARNPATPTPARQEGRYLFGLLDYRSSYGNEFFPDPFLGPEFDRETQLEADYLHGAKGGQREDEGDAGVQWNVIGRLTLAGELGYDSEHQPKAPGGITGGNDDKAANGRGFEDVDLAAYHPIFQAVSRDKNLDYSAVVRLDVGIPTHTAVSGTDVQLTPYLGQLLRIGEHVSVEAWAGSQFTIGPHRADQFIYGSTFGYQITHNQLSLPLAQTVTPLLELDGRTPFSNSDPTALFGIAGLNWQFTRKGEFQPRLGIGYEFPLDQGARDQLRWGIVTQVTLDF